MMKSKQLDVGNDTELCIAKLFREHHFWVYVTPKKIGGQPVDIIALKQNNNWLLDAKHVREEEISFPFKRIEPNQKMSMEYAHNWAKIQNIGFGILFERDMSIRYLTLQKFLEMAEKGLKSVNMSDLPLLEEHIND